MATAPKDARARADLPALADARLPYHPAIQERFGIDRASWRALTDAIFPAARSAEAVILALSYCKARKLDPFKRPVHIVPIYDKAKRAYVETVWPGIGELRTTANRTGAYAGCDACEFGLDVKHTFEGRVKHGDEWKTEKVEMIFPEWAQITVYRMIKDQRVAMPGPRVYWIETYATKGGSDLPNEMWQKRPRGQLEKCAEAAALRRAFPEEIGGDLTDDEAGGAADYQGPDQAKDVTPAKPTRADFKAPAPAPSEEAIAEADREMDRQYAATVGDRVLDDAPATEPESEGDAGWSTEMRPIPGGNKPKTADVLGWALDVSNHVKAAPTLDALKAFLASNQDGIKWFRDRFGTEGDGLKDVIDERLAALQP